MITERSITNRRKKAEKKRSREVKGERMKEKEGRKGEREKEKKRGERGSSKKRVCVHAFTSNNNPNTSSRH